MVQLGVIFGAILFIFIIISSDKNSDNRQYDATTTSSINYNTKSNIVRNRVITFDIYKIKGGLLNIDRRSFREGLKQALEGSSKFRVSYNPHIKMVLKISENVDGIKRYRDRKNGKPYYIVKKSVEVNVEYALFKDSRKTYFIDNFIYNANIKAGSYSNYDDAIYKINKRLYWIIGKRVANRLQANYEDILYNIRY